MVYNSLEDCLYDLEHNGHLIRIKEEVDPYLEMAAVHLKVHEMQGPALLFENVKGSSYRAASNIFGTIERSKFIFSKRFHAIQQIVQLRNNPQQIFKQPLNSVKTGFTALSSIPKKTTDHNILQNEI